MAVELRESVALVILSRPDVHNAFNATLIAELTRALRELDLDATVRAVVLLGEGKSVCAGADLNWMKEMAGFGATENLADANALAVMLKSLYRLSKPTIARVHGSAFGGGAGLVACCDIAFAAQDTTFSFSEAKLGLIPATIAPYVLEAIGARYARRYFLSAERFTAAEAFRIGLVHDIYPLDEIDARINELLGSLLVAGPRAQHESKALIRAVRSGPIDDTLIADTAARIARIRGSEEGREGVGAFLGKRAPAWVPQSLRKK
ncbi:MAG TPA: enoyl-CoA hydratase/isomerase family protein [Casimicrobiaceae bacterium]|nr:enoyl-CoA hydratase/isomerase family protein [Casimicrobiaceae bacterium]